jgi:hypothetical protein
VAAVLLFVFFFAVIGVVRSRIDGGLGVALGIASGGSLALGTLLGYWNLVDWRNLRVIRRSLSGGGSALRDGDVVAVDGFVRTKGDPMIDPFSRTPCAAYAYVVSYSRQSSSGGGSRRFVLAQGFHMVPTRIEGTARSVEVRSFPSFEDALRENVPGTKWGDEARALVKAISGKARAAEERERQSRLLELRHTSIEEVHEDYLMGEIGPSADGLVIDEEVLPAGEAVTMVGTYERERNCLTARRSRLGPNLFVYRGRAEEVLSRVGKESAGFAKAAAVLLGLGVVPLGLALLPSAITSRLPLIGSRVIVSPEPAAPVDPDAALRARIDGAVRKEYAAGNTSRALELAVDENAYESLRWLIEQGISPEMPMRVRGDWHQLPLVEAARRGHLETARTLLEAGADPNAVEPPESPPSPGLAALAAALMNGNCPVAQLLRDYGAAVPEGLETNPCG